MDGDMLNPGCVDLVGPHGRLGRLTCYGKAKDDRSEFQKADPGAVMNRSDRRAR
jgi:hypothetical protein